MKILLISGTHSRHLYFFRHMLELDADFAAIVMQRENAMPSMPDDLLGRDQRLFTRHFETRLAVETLHFGEPTPEEVFGGIPHHRCAPETLNNANAADFAASQGADMAVVFGPDLLKAPLFDALPKMTINLHLGLSPWYRGAATLFWPFYFLEPNFAGGTFHEVTASPDAGNLLHQSLPELAFADGIHDVAAKTVESSTADFVALAGRMIEGEAFTLVPQRAQGKLFSRHDFRAQHLRTVYEVFQDDIVSEFLAGNLSMREPRLHRAV